MQLFFFVSYCYHPVEYIRKKLQEIEPELSFIVKITLYASTRFEGLAVNSNFFPIYIMAAQRWRTSDWR